VGTTHIYDVGRCLTFLFPVMHCQLFRLILDMASTIAPGYACARLMSRERTQGSAVLAQICPIDGKLTLSRPYREGMSPGRHVRLPRLLPLHSAQLNRAARLFVSLLLFAGLVGCSNQGDDDSPGSGGELWLTAAEDPGHDPFMPPAASPPSAEPLPGPELTPQGDGTEVVAQQQPGDQAGLYGGSLNNAECDREKMIAFLESHPAEAQAFVAALNADLSLRWSKGTSVSVDQIGAYIRELTPAFLRVDTRVTNHGFDGANPIPLQSILQAGTAVLVDTYGVPRVRCYCGNPLTAPVALDVKPRPRGTPWPGYNPGAVVLVQPAKTVISVFVLVDIYTGVSFERVAGTIGQDSQSGAPPGTPSGRDNTAYDGTYVAVNSPSQVTVVIRNGRVVSLAEGGAGAGTCELAIQPDFIIGESTGEFSGSFTGSVSSGPGWCVPTNGTMSGRVDGANMTMTFTNATSGGSWTLQFVRS